MCRALPDRTRDWQPGENRVARILETGDVTSVLDVARTPAYAGRLDIFDSILARSQSAGRGQYRRHWSSPAGNVYAALRLPVTAPFTCNGAAVALGAWLAMGLRGLGYPCLLKWPNDVVLPGENGSGPRKVCGILLEEREGILLAGVGINVASAPAPEDLRERAALAAGSLSAYARCHGLAQPVCGELWKSLVNSVLSFYSDNCRVNDLWRETATGLLLWRDEPVVLEDGDRSVQGLILGVGSDGELILSSRGTVRHFLSGSIRRCNS